MNRNDYIQHMINECEYHINELIKMQEINPENSYCKYEIEKYKVKLSCYEKALEKAPVKNKDTYKCPNCNNPLDYKYQLNIDYCKKCGQAINWKEL